MVLHFPGPVEAAPKVGSRTQVTRMLEGFRAIGYDVEIVAGSSKQRKVAMKRVLEMMDAGRTIDLVYSKAATTPTALTDPNHLPIRPLLDARFFRRLRRRGVKIALFYPDVYWRFDGTRQRSLIRRWGFEVLHRFDLLWYRFTLDLLLVPSLRMAAWIPGWATSDRIRPLNPGGVIEADDQVPTRKSGDLRLFYVGGVSPPLYDISPMIDAVRNVERVTLKVCCPAGTGEEYEGLGDFGIEVVHENGEYVRDALRTADVVPLVFEPIEYRQFAMPIKLFEAIGAGRPVLATEGTAVGDFVSSAGVGWTVPNRELTSTLAALALDPEGVAAATTRVIDVRQEHSWARRAQYVVDELRTADCDECSQRGAATSR